MSDWKAFDFDSISQEAKMMHVNYLTGERMGGLQRQDLLEYWIAVVAWRRAKESAQQNPTPMGSTRWR